jgi:hypothetical protein
MHCGNKEALIGGRRSECDQSEHASDGKPAPQLALPHELFERGAGSQRFAGPDKRNVL